MLFFSLKRAPLLSFPLFSNYNPSSSSKIAEHVKYQQTTNSVYREEKEENLSFVLDHPLRHCHFKCEGINYFSYAERSTHLKVLSVHKENKQSFPCIIKHNSIPILSWF